ncbi:MAG: AsmA-like C-terminal region-containing protein, partial [Deltaproteobacteria bacterium]|nr:AsmA-like C-terminal region-containing protein [Deltaproteobacteria bacterium]
NLTMEGVEGKRLMETLNGDLQLTVFNGALKGINIGAMIREARHKIQGKALPQDNRAQTDFTELSASIKITNGILANNDLKAKSPLLRVSGEGTADLPNDRLNYLVNTSLVETSKGQGGKARSELRGITIPVRFTGSLSAPKYSLDPGQMLAAEAKRVVQKKKRKVQKKLEKKVQDKLGDKLGDKLRGLFGR